jgi:transitional endoplasmic reticulum ATPase
MDGAKKTGRPVFVLAATNHLERVDPAVLSRFTYKIEIPNPTPAQRQKLFTVFLNKYPHEPFDVDEMASELAKRAGDIGGRDIQGLVVRASQRAAQRAIAAGTPDRVLISKDDLLHQLAPQTTREISEADVEKAWAQIVLKPEVKASIVSKIRLFNSGDKAAPRGLLLYGPPGTGKTEIARRIAASAGCEFLSLTASDLKAGYTGQSGKQVKAVWDKARAYGRCIMFVDECEGVFGRRGGTNTDSFSEEVVREFLAMWDGVGSKGQVWVVGATNRRDQLDEAIVSRFGAAVEIGLPDAAERLQILALEMRKLERETVVPDFVGPATTGFAGRDLAQVARDVCTLAAETGGAIVPEHWRSVVGRYAKSTSDAVDERAKWESLILPEATVRKLKRLCEMLKHAETLQQQGIDPPRGALLFGPPGTGKTQIARTLANESGLAFIAAGPADIKGGYVGQSAIKVRELFERARGKAPAILFIDEIESGAASRDGGRGDQFTQDIVTELLTQMDGVKKNTRPVFVLAATNHPKLVDAAVVSRFEEQIEIPNPGQDERRRMIATFLGRQKVDFDIEELASEVSARTDGMSGRDLQSVVRRATQMALQRALDAGTPDRVLMQREDVMGQFTGFGH